MTTRRRVLLGLAAVLIAASAYLFFELGRYQAGYSVLERQRETERYRRRIDAQERTIEELKREVAILETSRNIDRETYSRLEGALTELETQVQAQEEELAFYRGIISPPDGVPGLRVQSLEIEPGGAEQRYVLRLVLMQAIAQNRRVAGIVRLHVTGKLDGVTRKIELPDLADTDDVTELEYEFRYFQGLEQEVVLPVGFEPAAVEVEVRPNEPRGETLTQTFEWAAASGAGREE